MVTVIKLAAGEAYTAKNATTESKKSTQNKPLDFLLAESILLLIWANIVRDLLSLRQEHENLS